MPVTDEAGQIEQIVVSFIDVTPWAEAERALAASEALLHVVLDNVGQNILRLDEDLRVDYVNAGVARMLGHPETPVIGRSLVDLGYPAPGLIDWSDHCQKVLTTARPDTFECCEHTSLGERWHELTVLPQVASDGTVAHVIVTHRDVTERKEAESSARVRQAQYEAAQLIASFGSWSMDLATQRITWSEELFRILGLDPSQTAPDIAHQESLYTNESWQRLSAAISEAQASGVPYELELETRRPDGSNGWVLTRGEAVRDLNGAIIGLQGVAADVTESRRAAAELTKLTTYDPLTGLPNRSALFDEISRTTSIGHHAGQHTTVLMVDLDHFKDINDTLGHESGDEVTDRGRRTYLQRRTSRAVSSHASGLTSSRWLPRHWMSRARRRSTRNNCCWRSAAPSASPGPSCSPLPVSEWPSPLGQVHRATWSGRRTRPCTLRNPRGATVWSCSTRI